MGFRLQPAASGSRVDSAFNVSLLFGLGMLALLAIPLVISIRRSNELFVLDVRKGTTSFRRGRMPQRLLDDIGDVVRKPRVLSATIRVVTEGGTARVIAKGQINEGQIQRVRNVLGTYEVAQIRAGGRPR